MQGLVQKCDNKGIGLEMWQYKDWVMLCGNAGIGLEMWQCRDWLKNVAMQGLIKQD